jgi:hypothetical protein
MWDFEFLCKAGLEICHVALIGIEKYQLQLMYQKNILRRHAENTKAFLTFMNVNLIQIIKILFMNLGVTLLNFYC